MAQRKKKSTQGIRKRATKKRREDAPADVKQGAREASVDLGPIEPEVADILAIIDRAKGREPARHEVEPEDERGRGGAAARRGRGGRADQRTPQQKDATGRRRTGKTKQL